MTRTEFRRVRRLLLSVAGALAISLVGIALTVLTGSLAIGWILVPGGMLALENMRMNHYAALWMYGGTILNVSLWTLAIYIVTEIVRGRRRRAVA
jgi:hypothetical protein